jgi:hypothetical protein
MNLVYPPPKPTPSLPEKFTVVELIDALGGPSAFARICGFTENVHARGGDLRRRQSIPVAHWQAVIDAAHKAGFKQVTWESLHRARQMPKPTKIKRLPRRKRRSSLV